MRRGVANMVGSVPGGEAPGATHAPRPSDPAVKQLLVNMDEKQSFIIQDLDDNHLLIKADEEDRVRKELDAEVRARRISDFWVGVLRDACCSWSGIRIAWTRSGAWLGWGGVVCGAGLCGGGEEPGSGEHVLGGARGLRLRVLTGTPDWGRTWRKAVYNSMTRHDACGRRTPRSRRKALFPFVAYHNEICVAGLCFFHGGAAGAVGSSRTSIQRKLHRWDLEVAPAGPKTRQERLHHPAKLHRHSPGSTC